MAGVNNTTVRGISADGKVAVGSMLATSGKDIPARWTKESGFVPLESNSDIIDNGYAQAASADGAVIVGKASFASAGGAFRWNATDGLVFLGLDIGSGATGVSSKGTAIVGNMASAYRLSCHAFRWTPAAGVVDLLNLGVTCSVVGVSADGTVMAGNYAPISGDYSTTPFIWNQSSGIVQPTSDIGLGTVTAVALSYDGSTIVGRENGVFRFVTNLGFTFISSADLIPSAVSGDGTTVTGYGVGKDWIWDTTSGMRVFEDMLVGLGVDFTEGHTDSTVLRIVAISAHGKTLVGAGHRNYVYTTWIARL